MPDTVCGLEATGDEATVVLKGDSETGPEHPRPAMRGNASNPLWSRQKNGTMMWRTMSSCYVPPLTTVPDNRIDILRERLSMMTETFLTLWDRARYVVQPGVISVVSCFGSGGRQSPRLPGSPRDRMSGAATLGRRWRLRSQRRMVRTDNNDAPFSRFSVYSLLLGIAEGFAGEIIDAFGGR